MGKKHVGMALAAVLSAGMVSSVSMAADVNYADVAENEWFYGYVKAVTMRELMTGYDSGAFGAYDNLGRGQFATILYRMEQKPEVKYSNMFPDVPNEQFYSLPAVWAGTEKVITGYDNGTFGPADDITREQLVTIMYRYAKMKGQDVTATETFERFPDAEWVSEFAKEAMNWAVDREIIKGTDDGRLEPQGNVSRAVCATIITRYTQEETLPEDFPQNFMFNNAAGAWNSAVTLNADGSFTGDYHDADVGDKGDAYPGGTVYVSKFNGKFDAIIKNLDGSYDLTLCEMNTEKPQGEEWIEEGVRYVASSAYGLDGGKFFTLYAPGTPLEGLSAEFLSWIPDTMKADGKLTCYTLWNRAQEQGLYAIEKAEEGDDASKDENAAEGEKPSKDENAAEGEKPSQDESGTEAGDTPSTDEVTEGSDAPAEGTTDEK